jgi:hypothetical protein
MSVNGVSGAGFNGYVYQPSMRSPDPTQGAGSESPPSTTASGPAAATSPPGNVLSSANAFQAMTGLDVTGAVTATMPDGITFGVYSFAPNSEAEAAAPFNPGDGSSANASANSGPNYAQMEAALEQMVDQFMASGFDSTSTSPTSATAQSAYQQSASNSSTQNGSMGTVA